MINKAGKKINIGYARYLRKRLSDRRISANGISRAEQHSFRVAKLRKKLVKILLLMVIGLMVWPSISNLVKQDKIDIHNNTAVEQKADNQANSSDDKLQSASDTPEIIKPRFYGHDKNGQPYNLSADDGFTNKNNDITLSNPEGHIALRNGSKLSLSSTQGDYMVKKKEVSLSGGVELIANEDYRFKTGSSYIKMDDQLATGSELVRIDGKLGQIIANGFTIRNSGEEIVLFGGVKLRAYITEIQKELDANKNKINSYSKN